MINRVVNFISSFFKGESRTIKARKNIIASLFIKGLSIIIGFLLVPIALDYLDQTKYGIWITISSFLAWFTFFEIGLGNGLRNKLAEALAKQDYKLGRVYVSTTYAILTVIIGVVSVLFFIGNQFIDWAKILNTDSTMASELSTLALIVFGFFFLRFVIKLINIILLADQRPALSNLFGPLGNLISLIVIYTLSKTTEGSLLYLGITYSVSPIIVLGIASIYFYSTEYTKIAPSFCYIEFKYAKDLLNLGVKFFIIQISALVIFQSSNIIIAQFFGPKEVTPYSITYQYFSVITMLFSIIMSPFWSAFTEAWVKKEISWVKMTINNLLKLWGGFVILAVVLLFLYNFLVTLWIGEESFSKMHVSWHLKYLLVLYFLLHTFGGIFNMFINGVGKIKLQTISLVSGAILFIPLAIGFIKYLGMGMEGIVMASIIANFYTPFIAPIQYYKIVNNKANGIWNS